MKNILLIAFALLLFTSCKKRGISQTELSNVALGPVWKAYSYSKNGVVDSAVIKRNPTFEFRINSKLYITRIAPAFADTLVYQFVNDLNIKAAKPTINSLPFYNFFIDRIETNNFDFTITSSTGDVEKYKTSH